jgi:hypothetical protein
MFHRHATEEKFMEEKSGLCEHGRAITACPRFECMLRCVLMLWAFCALTFSFGCLVLVAHPLVRPLMAAAVIAIAIGCRSMAALPARFGDQ